MEKRIITFVFSLVTIICVSSFLIACSNNKGFSKEQQQIEATIRTSSKLVAVNYIDNTISFTNVLDKDAEIEITYKFNNGVSFSDTVKVEAHKSFSKTYSGGYSVATFTIKILSLA